MELIAQLAKIILSVDARIEDLKKFTKLQIFDRSAPRTASTFCPNESVSDAMKTLQDLNSNCQKSVDEWDLDWRAAIGIEGFPPMDKAIADARAAVEAERHRRSEYFEKRAKYLLLIGRHPDNTNEYRKALMALDQDIILDLEAGANKIMRCFQTISLILKKLLEIILNPPTPPQPSPPPPGMYV